MSSRDGHFDRCRQRVMPPFSNRTLHHPSYMPMYMSADFAQQQAARPIIPADLFYADPFDGFGGRIPSMLSGLQLVTPPPIMSACVAPPIHPDPFRYGPYPTRPLGCPTWRTPAAPPPPRRVVVNLTQEEDQAVTNLLKLHHLDGAARADPSRVVRPPLDSVLGPFGPSASPRLVSVDSPRARETCSGNEGGRWSDIELEAANTLMSFCNQRRDTSLRSQSPNKTDPVPCQRPDRRQNSKTSPETGDRADDVAENVAGSTRSNLRPADGSAADPSPPGLGGNSASSSPPSLSSKTRGTSRVSGESLQVLWRELSESELIAVEALLSLGDVDNRQ